MSDPIHDAEPSKALRSISGPSALPLAIVGEDRRVQAAGQAGARLAVRQGAAVLGALVDLLLDLGVVKRVRDAVAVENDGHLLARSERPRVAGQVG